MLSFVQNWFAPKVNPIGVDFGSDCLRLAQVHYSGHEYRLIAAASTDVPSHVRGNMSARMAFFVEAVRDMLLQGNFRSRHAVLGLPASSMYIQHLRMARLDEDETAKALVWEAQGKLPIDPSQALMRHLIAGEVYQEQEPRNEVIVMAAAREMVNQLLASAAKAKLDVVGMNVEPKALIDCFSHIYRRKLDSDSTTCFLDIGCTASRAVIARGEQIFFARAIPVGGDHFNKATSQALKISLDEAKLLRIKLCAAQPHSDEQRERRAVATPPAPTVEPGIENSFAVLNAAMKAKSAPSAGGTPEHPSEPPQMYASQDAASLRSGSLGEQALLVEQACNEPLSKLIEELDFCRRYYEATFPSKPVDRLVFVGGEARHRSLCQHIARELNLAAQLGDPLARMSRASEIGIESGIDRRQPQPSWAVAIGLSLGPVGGALSEGTARSAVASAATEAS